MPESENRDDEYGFRTEFKEYPRFPLEANLSTQEYVRQYIKANHLIPDPCDHQFELCFDKEFAQCSKCGLVVKSFSLEGS